MSAYIFVDASAWIALINRNDDNYGKAAPIWQSIVEHEWLLLTTNWTLYEALTILKTKGSTELAKELWDLSQLRDGGMVRVVTVSARLEKAAVWTFFQHRDKMWSVVDCANFHAVREENCQRVFAYDDDFRQASGEFEFQLLG